MIILNPFDSDIEFKICAILDRAYYMQHIFSSWSNKFQFDRLRSFEYLQMTENDLDCLLVEFNLISLNALLALTIDGDEMYYCIMEKYFM